MNEDKVQHPQQPLYLDGMGVQRFKANAIVRFLLDQGPHDLNKIAMLSFTTEDRQQFYQLIGYSLSAFGELDFVVDEAFGRAELHTVTPPTAAGLAESFALKLADAFAVQVRPQMQAYLQQAIGEAGGLQVPATVGESLETVERRMILATLGHCQGSKERAAATLGISLKTLYNRLKEYSLESAVGAATT